MENKLLRSRETFRSFDRASGQTFEQAVNANPPYKGYTGSACVPKFNVYDIAFKIRFRSDGIPCAERWRTMCAARIFDALPPYIIYSIVRRRFPFIKTKVVLFCGREKNSNALHTSYASNG